MRNVKIAAAQTNEFREDMDAALACLTEMARRSESEHASLLCFPEGYLQGYLTDEVAARRNALDLASPKFEAILKRFPAKGPMIVVGLIELENDRLFNTAIVVHHGRLIGRYRKAYLLGVEQFFDVGTETPIFEVDGLRFGILICYDTNFPAAAAKIAELGGSLIVCPANNMLKRKSAETWKDVHNSVRGERCRESGLWLISADVTGERDGRVAWGPTALLNPSGQVVAQLGLERPGLLLVEVPATSLAS